MKTICGAYLELARKHVAGEFPPIGA